jgi:hypothetical protein
VNQSTLEVKTMIECRTIRMQKAILLGASNIWLFAACQSSLPIGIRDEPPVDSLAPIATDSGEYHLSKTPDYLEGRIVFAYTNPLENKVYMPGCKGASPPSLQKWDGKGWVDAWLPVEEACSTEPPVSAEPHGTVTDTLLVLSGLQSYMVPRFNVEPISGHYRLVWSVYSAWQGRLGDEHLLPLEQRVSTPFRIIE